MGRYMDERRRRVDAALEGWLSKARAVPERLMAAMRHSLFSGGKRLRPILALAAAEACGGDARRVLPAACGLECLHTYSLIHDDLPALDDDDLRRGRPTCHKAFDEATAILAGDALQTCAFELVAQACAGLAAGAEPVRLLARAAGMAGMVGGQVADLAAEHQAVDLPGLQYIHDHKTGDLILASLLIGARLAGADARQRRALTAYGRAFGLAFQITDDILNVVGESQKLGKSTGTDAARGKATYPGLMGLEASSAQARRLVAACHRALRPFGHTAKPLAALADFLMEREV